MVLAAHPARLLLACAVVLVAALGLGAPRAHAAYTLTTDPNYTVTTEACHQLGQSDDNGVFYTMCGAKIYRYDKNGVRLADIALPGGLANPYDVAPSPDGAFLYVSQGASAPRRLNRQANGTYTLDATWRLGKFSVWNVLYAPIGHAIATDGRGDIYLSQGSYWSSEATQNSIAKFRPDGVAITAFGDYGKADGFWITNQDIAVTRDGRRVYVGENCGKSCIYTDADYQGSRVTRYDFTPGGTYRYSRIISAQGPMDGNKFPRCESAGATHSAYSLALDYWENLYVSSTTCGRIQKFATFADPAKDKFVASIAVYVDPNTAIGMDGKRNHYLTSDWAGRIYTSEWQRKFTPKVIKVPATPLPALAPLPEPDIVAPVLKSITMPASTTTRSVPVSIVATDDREVAEMQFAHEDGAWGQWQPFATPVSYDLSAGYGVKGVYVRVRDMGGNESQAVYRTIGYAAVPVDDGGGGPLPPVGTVDVAAPVLSAFTVPALTATQAVQATVTATDDVGVRSIRFANEDGVWSAWKAFAATSTWTLSAGEGQKVVYAQVRDAAGNESTALTARTRFALDAPAQPPAGGAPDTVAPVLVSLKLPAETTTQAVSAALVATDAVGVAQVRFANEDGNWTAWQAYGATRTWSLTAGYGGKLVYAQVRDAAGNESLTSSATTSYVKTVAGPVDAADPVLTSVSLPAIVKTAAVTLTLVASDDVGVAEVRTANEDGTWGPWRAYAAQVPHTLSAGNTVKLVYAQVRDAAGRESNVSFVRTQVTP
ncbi:MAG: phage tail protein [Thermoleophilia bacterium]|nr:phage tail protein [Thermoleophilia bacterium]